MKSKLAVSLLPEIQAILEHNGIDWKRATSVEVKHDVEGAVTAVTVTLFALAPEDDE